MIAVLSGTGSIPSLSLIFLRHVTQIREYYIKVCHRLYLQLSPYVMLVNYSRTGGYFACVIKYIVSKQLHLSVINVY